MSIEKLLGNQSVLVSLDVDHLLFERLKKIEDAGISTIEINSTDPKLLAQIIAEFPSAKIGASGVVDIQQLENCYHAGVSFASSPGFLPAIAQTAAVYAMNFLPGVATLSEAMAAMALGFQHVRPFPADLAFCTLLNKCLPHLKLFPAEIEWEEAEHFFNLPSVIAVSFNNPDNKQLHHLNSGILA